jgi:hypothetical protein
MKPGRAGWPPKLGIEARGVIFVIVDVAFSPERLANGKALFMCQACDMDAPVRGDTGYEVIE